MMCKYLKMGDYFADTVFDGFGNAAAIYGIGVKQVIFCGKHAAAAAHAINSHDELVAEVERLRGMVIRMQTYLDMAGEYPEK
ncbi:MAG: hypothetical protein ACRCXB_31365 [Aeromonadaceae bacterium]